MTEWFYLDADEQDCETKVSQLFWRMSEVKASWYKMYEIKYPRFIAEKDFLSRELQSSFITGGLWISQNVNSNEKFSPELHSHFILVTLFWRTTFLLGVQH